MKLHKFIAKLSSRDFWVDAWYLVSLRVVQLLLLGGIVAFVWLLFWVWIPEIRDYR